MSAIEPQPREELHGGRACLAKAAGDFARPADTGLPSPSRPSTRPALRELVKCRERLDESLGEPDEDGTYARAGERARRRRA